MVKQPPGKTISKILFYALVVSSIFNLWIIFFLNNDSKVQISDIAFIVLNGFSVWAAFLAGRLTNSESKKKSLAWYLIAGAQFLFVLGDVVWYVYEGILFIEPYPSLADLFYMLYYPVILIGIFIFPKRKISKPELSKTVIDFLLTLLSAGLVSWFFLLSPAASGLEQESFLVKFLSVGYPAADLILLLLLLVLIYKYPSGREHSAIFFLILSISVQIISDVIFSYQSLMDTYINGSWVDCGWILGYLFLGLAAIIQIQVEQKENSEKGFITSFRNLKLDKFIKGAQKFLPYFFVFTSYSVLVFYVANEIPERFLILVVGIGIIILLSMLRQYLVIKDNEKLNKELESILTDLAKKNFQIKNTNEELRSEIQQRKKAEKQLSFDALHDCLTKLPNRTLLLDRLNHAIEIVKRNADYSFSVLFLDLDQFKNVNDTLGHSVGDELLKNFSDRVQECIRNSDTFARLGGDEFAILLGKRDSADDATHVADRIQEVLREPYLFTGQNLFITASIGIVNDISKNYNNAEEILRDADIAMYRAKELGKARYQIFSSSMRSEMLSKITMESQLRTALENKNFVIHYQPIFSLEQNELIGFEALLRWDHPQLGLLMPIDFLSVAESSGMILEIGDWVLRESCKQLQKWINKNPQFVDLSISINFSRKQIIQPDFIERIKSALQETELAPRNIHVDIAEIVLMNTKNLAEKISRELYNMGINLQIDDFGSGYSTVRYLQHLPVNSIKIDSMFIKDIEKNKKNFQLVQTIINMAEDLNVKIIAEGIETKEQLSKLKAMTCEYGQGFYLSYPMPVEKVEKLFQQIQARDDSTENTSH